MIYWIMPALVFIALAFAASGCSTMKTMKECKQVDGEDIYVCKTLKPWE